MDRPGYSVVTDETTGRIYVRKELKIYDRRVYEYLKEHKNPHIPAVCEVWEKEGALEVLEAFIQGDTLRQLQEQRRLSEEQKRDILLQICDALNFLHSANPPIIHRDVKEDNILVTEDGRAYLIDYDAAKMYHEDQSRDTVLLGTEGSAAPEQYGFRQSDARTDVYGVGALIRDLFPGNSSMQRIARKAMRMEPDERYQTVRELKRDIERGGTGRINIPGFRTGSVWKMLTASLVYLLILGTSFTLKGDVPGSVADIWLNRIFFLLTCGSLIDLYTNWTKLFRHFPLIHSHHVWIRLPGYVLGTLLLVFFWITFLLAIEKML